MTGNFDAAKNHFELFGLGELFELDAAQLELTYRDLQAKFHPDKSVRLSDSEQRQAMQRSTRVNEAYQTLKSSIRRARYLLGLKGVDTQEETNTAMPVEFLMTQMEWREAVVDAEKARDIAALDTLDARMKIETRELEAQLRDKIDIEHDYPIAAGLVRKLRFMEKLAEEIHSAYDELEN